MPTAMLHRDAGPAAENGHARRVRATKDRVLAAAGEAFARDGYGATTIERIAEAAGTAPASVYNHFQSKEGVAQALAERALETHDEYIAGAWSLDVSPLERLIAAAGATLAFASEQPTMFQAMSLSFLRPLELFPAGTPAAHAIAARRELQLARIVANLEAAVGAGELRSMDVLPMARFIVGAWAGVLTMATRPEAQADSGAIVGAGVRAIVKGHATSSTLTRDGNLRARYERALLRHGLGGR
jgi:AcrR family transcriptional regulator